MEIELYRQAGQLRTGAYIGVVVAIGSLTFYALPDGLQFMVTLTMMVNSSSRWAGCYGVRNGSMRREAEPFHPGPNLLGRTERSY